MTSALKEVLHNAKLEEEGLACGLHRVCEGIKQNRVQLVIVAKDCDDANYAARLGLHCAEQGVLMLRAATMAQLGEYAGLCARDKDGALLRVRPAGSVAVQRFGEMSDGLRFLIKHVQKHAPEHLSPDQRPPEKTQKQPPAPAAAAHRPDKARRTKHRPRPV